MLDNSQKYEFPRQKGWGGGVASCRLQWPKRVSKFIFSSAACGSILPRSDAKTAPTFRLSLAHSQWREVEVTFHCPESPLRTSRTRSFAKISPVSIPIYQFSSLIGASPSSYLWSPALVTIIGSNSAAKQRPNLLRIF